MRYFLFQKAIGNSAENVKEHESAKGMVLKSEYEKVILLKSPADNRQFGASGGVVSCDTSQEFESSPPVRALPIPPPDAKLLKRCGQVYSV